MTLTLIPDAELILGDYLRELPAIVAIGANVAPVIPSNTTKPWVRVTLLDARKIPGSEPDWLVEHYLQFDCYADATATKDKAGQGQASLLARTVRAALEAAKGQTLGAAAVVCDVHVTNMARVPDETFDPARPRYVLDELVVMRPA